MVDGTFYVLRHSLSSFMTYVGCLNVIGHQMTSLVYSYPPLSFFETPLSFVEDQRRVEKEKPVERCRTFRRVYHLNTALQRVFKLSIFQLHQSKLFHLGVRKESGSLKFAVHPLFDLFVLKWKLLHIRYSLLNNSFKRSLYIYISVCILDN